MTHFQQDYLEEYEEQKRRWEINWADADFSPTWRITKIPQEIQDAVDSGWFPPRASVLDIGCGSGEIAAWLAERNFNVLGIDYSQAAIERAKLAHGEIPGKLKFKTVDICRDIGTLPKFDCLIDRGCFHVIHQPFSGKYVNIVASCSVPGARFLLLAKNRRPSLGFNDEYNSHQEEINYITTIFEPRFKIFKIESTFLERTPPDEPVPGLAVWMMQKESQQEIQETKSLQLKMGGKSTLRILVKGDRDPIDSLLSIARGGQKLDRGLQELVDEKYKGAFKIEIIYEPGGRSDLWLQQLAGTSFSDNLQSQEVEGGTFLTQQSQSRLLEKDIDVIVFSTQAEITVGGLSVEQSQENFSQIIQILKQKTDAYIIFYNCSDFDPIDSTHNYHKQSDNLRLRIQKLNLALIKLSIQEGISLIDVESILAELGAIEHIIKALDYSGEAYQTICQEFLRVLEDVGFFEKRPLLMQIGQRRDFNGI